MTAETAGWFIKLKVTVGTLVLSPVPLLLLALAGAWRARRHPREGWALLLLSVALLWLGSSVGGARWVERHGLDEPEPLNAAERAQLKIRAGHGERLAIVVLGGGMEADVREYGGADLTQTAFMRLRYALWLSRQTGLPVAASGGQGWTGIVPGVPTEAARMAEIAQSEYGLPLKWVETDSHDTHQNAVNTVALLRAAGVREIELVTHGAHMPRALREFRAAAAAASPQLVVMPAPMGQGWPAQRAPLQWLPSPEGARRMHAALHEIVGLMATPR